MKNKQIQATDLEKSDKENSKTLLNVYIPVRNRNAQVKKCISWLKRSDCGIIDKIIVIDSNSKKPIVEKRAIVERTNFPNWNKAWLLNRAILKYPNKFIMTLDVDMILDKEHFLEISKNLTDSSFICDTNVRRIDKKQIDKDYRKMIENSKPWRMNDTSQLFNTANGGFQVYSYDFFTHINGIQEGLGLYHGSVDNVMYYRARMNSLNVVDISYPLLHVEHSKKKEQNYSESEQIVAGEYRQFKATYLSHMIMNNINKNPETIGLDKPNMEMFYEYKNLKLNQQNIINKAVQNKEEFVTLGYQKFKLEKAKPSIMLAVIDNYGMLPDYFVWDLFNLFNYTRQSGYDIEICPVNACDVNSLRNTAVKMAKGELGGKKYDYMVQLDSVTPETPLFIKRNNMVDFVEIQELFKEDNCKINVNGEKVYSHIPKNIEIYTRNGWKKIAHVMKHNVKKPIYHLGGDYVTRTTGDHSLFKDGEQIKPSELKEGDIIDTVPFNEHKDYNSITPELAEFFGFFCAEGTTTYSKNHKSKKGIQYYNYMWNVTGQDAELLKSYSKVLEGFFCRDFKIEKNSTGYNKNVCYRLVPQGERKDMYEYFRNNFYTKSGYKKIPQVIFNSNEEIIKAFLKGYINGDGHTYNDGSQQYSTNSYILSAGLNHLYERLGKKTRHYIRKDKPTIITTKVNVTDKTRKIGIGKKIIYEDYEGEVYDICTEDGTFVGGVGNVLFKNTDHHYPPEYIVKFLKMSQENNWPIITGLTSRKSKPYSNTQYYKILDKITETTNCISNKEKGIIDIEASGPVGMLIRTEVFEKIKWPYYEMDFTPRKIDGRMIDAQLGGDLVFCKKLKELGIKIKLDMDVSFPHEVRKFVNRGKIVG